MADEVIDIIFAASKQVQDEIGIVWPDVMLPYLNLALQEIVNLKPEAYPTTEVTAMTAGAQQSIPTGYIQLLDVICNMGSGGSTPGSSIKFIKRHVIEMALPNWMEATTSDTVTFAIREVADPKSFYVFPPNSGDGNIKAIYSAAAPKLTTDADTFVLDVSYMPACVDYIVYRCLAEETTIPYAQQKSAQYWNKFLADLGLKTNREMEIQREVTQGEKGPGITPTGQ